VVKIQNVDPAELTPADYNPRSISEHQAEALKRSLDRWGFVEPIVANKRTGRIVGGHQRLDGALALALPKVPVHWIDVDESSEKALNIALNKISGDWDEDLLGKLLADLERDGQDLEDLGFDADELQAIIDAAAPEPELSGDLDAIPEPPAEPITQPGDLWQLGEHRLLCGDSTNADDVARLMDGAKADAVVTDPPYGTNQPGVPHDSPEEHASLIGGVLGAMPLAQNATIISFASPRTFPVWLDAIRSAGHAFNRMLWLYKEAQMANPWRGWIMKSEAILVSSVGDGSWSDSKPYDHDCYKVPFVDKELSDDQWHGSVKPLDIVARLCRRTNGTIYEPFSGSGTTLIAAEQTGRKCYAMEISPAYCDVAVKRWEQATGRKAERIE
jgi:ParB-like chromosome segregation protein Spo0J